MGVQPRAVGRRRILPSSNSWASKDPSRTIRFKARLVMGVSVRQRTRATTQWLAPSKKRKRAKPERLAPSKQRKRAKPERLALGEDHERGRGLRRPGPVDRSRLRAAGGPA